MNPSHRINELNDAEEPAKELLRKLGYTYVPRQTLAAERDDEREVLLKGRLKRALLRLNPWLTEDQAARAIFRLEHVDAVGMARNQIVHEYLTYGMPLDVDEPGGRRTRTAQFFDFDHPDPRDGRNEFVVTTQLRVRRGSERDAGRAEDDEKLVIPDLVLFVNGIPLVVAEAKSRMLIGDLAKARAVRRLLRYQEAGPEWRGRGAPELFDYNLLCVALGGDGAWYGPLGAAENEYVAWKTVATLRRDDVEERYGVELPDGSTPSGRRETNPNAALAARGEGEGAPRAAPAGLPPRPGGEIIATVPDGARAGLPPAPGGREGGPSPAPATGHGQAELIAALLNPRTLLDILRDFVVYEPEKGRLVKKLPRYQQYRAVTAAMARLRKETDPEKRGGVVWHTQGSGKSLSMLWLAVKLRREPRLQNPTIVVVTDRTQLDQQISATFERCGFPAPEHAASARDLRDRLTGAPGRTLMTTIQKFEEALLTPDGRLAPLNPADNVYVMVDEAHRTQYGMLAAKMRLALPRAAFVGFTGTPIDKGFKRSTMRRFGPLIDTYTIPRSVEDGATVPILYEARLTELAIQGPNTLDRLFEALFGDQSDEVKARIKRRYANKETIAIADRRIEQIALDVATHFNERIRPNGFKAQLVAPSRLAAVTYARKLNDFGVEAYPIIATSNDDEAIFAEARALPHDRIIAQFKDPEGTPQVLVVVDMLLIGFDAPVEQVLYLDRGLREHGLLQAIARVNRRCTIVRDGVATEKTYGLVVDYWGVSRDLEDALSDFEQEDVADAWHPLDVDPALVIDDAARQAESYFPSHRLDDIWAAVNVFAAEATTDGDYKVDLFERFSADYRYFARLVDQFLPDPRALAYADRLARLTKIRAYARATFRREDATIDWEGVSAKVKKLIDDRIDANVVELMRPVSILGQDFAAKVHDLPHDEARASVMEHAIRAEIKGRLAENPAFYEKLSEQLERVIRAMRAHLIDAASAVRELWTIRRSALSVADLAAQQGLTEVSFAVYELLEQVSPGEAGATDRADSQPAARQVREPGAAYRAGLDERLKAVALGIEQIMARGQEIFDWQAKDDVQRLMRRDIKRELRRFGGIGEEQINELATSMVEIARRKLTR